MAAYATSLDVDVSRALATARRTRRLTELSPVLYRTDTSGSVSPSNPAGPVIDEARALRLKIIPVIQNLHGNTWDRAMIAAIVADDSRRSHHIQQIVDTAVQNKWDGIDIDYEALEPADSPAYLQFIRQLSAGLHRAGKQLAVAVPARTSDSPDDPVAQAADYDQIASAADEVRVMAYDHSWETSTPGPVAPIDWVRQVLQYAQRHIPPRKLMLGIAGYGYDWANGRGIPIGANAAASLASQQHATVRWDGASDAAWFKYTSDSEQHTVWFDNAQAMNPKVRLAAEAGIRGIIVWELDEADPAFWTGNSTG